MGRGRNRQRGAALILFLTVLVLGVAWFAVGALGKAMPATAEREIRTGHALQAAKQALLAYVALKAAEPGEKHPGRLPCPETPAQVGTSAEGRAAPIVSPPFPTCSAVGRLPWRTLGIAQLRDGYGEPLWYAVPTGSWALVNSSTVLDINPGLANQLTFDAQPNAVVAVIIAPGPAINGTSLPGTPPAGCGTVNQQVDRYAVPYDPAKFLECGNESGSYITAAPAPWGNDRAIAITASEVMDAIAGPVADRVQRQVLPALADWNQIELAATGKSWSSPYLPFASPFSDPDSNYYCGAAGETEGLTPLASRSSPNCSTLWTANASLVLGLSFLGCTQYADRVQCDFQRIFGTAPFSARIVATAPKVAGSFRGPLVAGDVTYTGSPTSTSLSFALSEATGDATATVDVTWPSTLASMSTVTVRVPHLQDAAVLSDSRVTWFRSNNWQRHVYYAVAPSATANSTSSCAAAEDDDCLEVVGLPDSTGNYWNKRLVLALVGQPTGGQIRSCGTYSDPDNPTVQDCDNVKQYLEAENAEYGTGPRVFRANLRIANPSAPTLPLPPFNDRVATCPLQYATDGGAVVICN